MRDFFWKVLGLAILLSIVEFGATRFVMKYEPPSWPVGYFFFFLILNYITFTLIFAYFQARRVVTVRIEDEHNIDSALRIASETLPYMRRGLNEETAQVIAQIIQDVADVAAVAITDKERVLAYVGAGCERHQPGRQILTYATKQVLATGEMMIVDNKKKLNCPVKDCDCPLEAAVIAPLKVRGEVAGCVKLYQTKQGQIPPYVIKLAVGIAQILSLQMELAEADRQAQLVTRAELQALHAQINPHFLFNTLNTIIMFSRTNPETARRLLIRLAAFFRQTLKKHGLFTTLREELEFVNTYLVLEKARFREKLKIIRDIDPELLDYKIPTLTLQPLVENAVKHGITPKMGTGAVHIIARKVEGELVITVRDDGVGIPRENLPKVVQPGFGSGNGVGLSNVNERLKSLFGKDYALQIESEVGKGTTVTMRVPLIVDEEMKEVETLEA